MVNISNDCKMMSSREIAALTEKNHQHIMRDIRQMLEDLEPEKDARNFGDISDESPSVQGFKESLFR